MVWRAANLISCGLSPEQKIHPWSNAPEVGLPARAPWIAGQVLLADRPCGTAGFSAPGTRGVEQRASEYRYTTAGP